VNTYVLILFRVFKYSYNYQHFEYHARDDNLVHSNVRNVNRCEARCSSGEEHGMSPWRRLQWVRALEKPVAGERRGGEGGRWVVVLWHGGDADRQSGGAIEREAWWRASSPRRHDRRGRRDGEHHHRRRRELSWHCGEVSFSSIF
jgi:hypothetical protein